MTSLSYPLSDLVISPLAKKYVAEVLDSNRLSYGPKTKAFETLFAKIHQRKFASFTNSGTSGLQIALQAMKEIYNWDDGDEILVPAVTFIATSNIVLHCGLTPVFVDVEPEYYCMRPDDMIHRITAKTRAVMPVHLFGQSADMEQICSIARNHGLRILEDACEVMFVNYKGKPVGSLGDAAVYSTYIAHILVTGVGGIVVSDDALLATRIRSLMFHGRDNIYLSIDDDNTKNPVKLNSLIERRFQFNSVGHSFRITEMESAIGLAQLEGWEKIVKDRTKTANQVIGALQEFSSVFQLPAVRPEAEHIYMLFPIVITDERIDKNDLLLYMEMHGIETRLFFPLLSQPIYKKLFGDIEHLYPVAKHLVERGFIIGCHPHLKKEQINHLQQTIRTYLREQKLV